MKSIPKFMATVVVFIIAVLVCISLIFAALMVSSARTHHNNVIAEIEASNFDADVINNCIQTANDKGYALTITKENNMSSTKHYKVTLYYDLVLPLFGKVHTGKLVGYAYPGATVSGELTGTADHYFEIDSNGVLGIKATYRWATGLDDYASDNGKDAAGSKNALLPSEITIPTYWEGREVKALRNYMFAGDTALTKLTFEEGVEKVGDNAFLNCTNLDGTIVMADSVETIGVSAFENCTLLDKVQFNTSSTLETVGDYAFKNCTGFVNVELPDTMTSNGFGSFQGCVNMVSYKAPFVGASPTASKKTGGYIGHIFATADHTTHNTEVPPGLSSVHITSYVTYYACYNMDQLTNLTLGEKITNFGMWPFALCDGLTSVTIPKNVVETEYAAFYKCANLATVTFAPGSQMTTLGNTNFAHCKKLTTIQLPNTVREIGNGCFEECDSLTFQTAATGKIPEGVTTIGEGAYSYCDSASFTVLEIPSTVTSIEPSLTTDSQKVTRISVAAGNKAYCTGDNGELLTIDKSMVVQYPDAGPANYTVPKTVTTIYSDAFERCDNLRTLNFENDSMLTTIEDGAFSRCSNIESDLILPSSVTYIGEEAFYHSGQWKVLKIGANVSYIGDYAFYDAGGIAVKMYLLMTVAPTIEDSAFRTNTVSGGTITQNYIIVKSDDVYKIFDDDKESQKIYRPSYTVVTVDGSIS